MNLFNSEFDQKILANEEPAAVSVGAAEPSPPSKIGPCPECNEPAWWEDRFGRLHCPTCKPVPRNKTLVAAYCIVVTCGGQFELESIRPRYDWSKEPEKDTPPLGPSGRI